MRTFFGSHISENMTLTQEGYLVCHDVPLARTGWQDYVVDEIDPNGEMGFDPGTKLHVLRSPEEVFNAAAMASFEGKAVTDKHPPEWITSNNHSAYARGHVQNVRRGTHTVDVDGEACELLIGDLIITDPALHAKIRSGQQRDTSCGYRNLYVPISDEPPSAQQQRIRANHVAIVPRGRAGRDIAVQDAAPEEQPPMAHDRNSLIQLGLTHLATTKPAELPQAMAALFTQDAVETAEEKSEREKKERESKDGKSKDAKSKDGKSKDAKSKDAKSKDEGNDDDETEEEMAERMERRKKAKESKESKDGKTKDADDAVERKLDTLISLMARATGIEVLSADAEKVKPLTEDDGEGVKRLTDDEIPDNPFESTEIKIHNAGSTFKESGSTDAAAELSFLAKIRPIIAKSKDSALRTEFNQRLEAVTNGGSRSQDQSYAAFTKLEKPQSVKDEEMRAGRRTQDADPQAEFEDSADKYRREMLGLPARSVR